MNKKIKKIAVGLIIGILSSIFVSFFTTFFFESLFNKFENFTYDMRYKWKYSPRVPGADLEKLAHWEPDEDVIVCDIDERAMSKYGVYWKWPRSYHGDISEILSQDGAAVTGFDIIFSEADFGESESKKIEKALNKIGYNPSKNKKKILKESVNYDQMFCSSVKKAGNVVAGMLLSDSTDFAFGTDWHKKSTESWRLSMNPGSGTKLPDSISKHFKQLKYSHGEETLGDKDVLGGVFPRLAQSAKRIGHVNVVPDADGVHRKAPLLFNYRGYTYPALSLQMMLQMLDITLSDVTFKLGEYINLGKPLKVWKDSTSSLRSSYRTITGPMIYRIVELANKIKKLNNNGSVTVSSYMRLFKNENGDLNLELLSGEIPKEVIKELIAFSWNTLDVLPYDKPTKIGDNTSIIPYEDATFDIVQIDKNGEEIDSWESNDNAISYMFEYITQELGNSLKRNESKLISSDITITKRNGIYHSQCPVLRGKTIEDLIKIKKSDLKDLKQGIKLSLGSDIKIPIDDVGRHIITYRGPVRKSVKFISYYDIKEGRIADHFFQHKAILIGSSAAALFDIVASPFSGEFPGVELHATILSDFIDNVFMRKLSFKNSMIILIAMGAFVGTLAYLLKPLWAALISFVLLFGHFLFAMAMFDGNLWVEIVRPVLTVFISYVSVVAYRYMTEEKDKKFLHETFKQYLSPELIEQMYEDKQMPSLGGEEGVNTAYFTDIQGFSTFSEELGSPVRLVELLNEYLSEMTDVLLEEKGTLDKYEGDAIIAFFGAPMPLPDHATRACISAIKMQKSLDKLRKKWVSEGDKWPKIVHGMRMRIGINSGSIVTGNMGSKVRMNFTMMGDAVNLAARLESGAKMYGVFIMCSEDTLKMTDGSIISRQLDIIRVVGKSEPVSIHEIICTKDELNEKHKKLIELFGKGYKLYRETKWDEAIKFFDEALEYEHNWGEVGVKTCPSIVMKDRCIEYKNNPPVPVGEKWDGIYTATSK